jgi:hypothetical protein
MAASALHQVNDHSPSHESSPPLDKGEDFDIIFLERMASHLYIGWRQNHTIFAM